ncbi:31186_t:CDS:2, partial [Gigaspora margarita]
MTISPSNLSNETKVYEGEKGVSSKQRIKTIYLKEVIYKKTLFSEMNVSMRMSKSHKQVHLRKVSISIFEDHPIS